MPVSNPIFISTKPKHPLFTGGVLVWALYQLGNWKAGKTIRGVRSTDRILYQLGNWKAGKTIGIYRFLE